MGKETEVKDSELSGEVWEWWCRATKHDEEHLETKKEKDGWEGKREIERGSEGQVDAPTRHFPFFSVFTSQPTRKGHSWNLRTVRIANKQLVKVEARIKILFLSERRKGEKKWQKDEASERVKMEERMKLKDIGLSK